MNKEKDKYLQLYHIRDACQQIAQYIQGYSLADFTRDSKTQDAAIRQIQVIGEAARQLDGAIRDSIPAVPWSDIIGMRHRIIHDYLDIELPLVWDTVTREVPDLLEKIQPALLKN